MICDCFCSSDTPYLSHTHTRTHCEGIHNNTDRFTSTLYEAGESERDRGRESAAYLSCWVTSHISHAREHNAMTMIQWSTLLPYCNILRRSRLCVVVAAARRRQYITVTLPYMNRKKRVEFAQRRYVDSNINILARAHTQAIIIL